MGTELKQCARHSAKGLYTFSVLFLPQVGQRALLPVYGCGNEGCDVRKLAQVLIAGQWHSWNLNSGLILLSNSKYLPLSMSSIHSSAPHAPHLYQDILSYSVEKLYPSHINCSLSQLSASYNLLSLLLPASEDMYLQRTCAISSASACTLFCRSSTLYKSCFLL